MTDVIAFVVKVARCFSPRPLGAGNAKLRLKHAATALVAQVQDYLVGSNMESFAHTLVGKPSR